MTGMRQSLIGITAVAAAIWAGGCATAPEPEPEPVVVAPAPAPVPVVVAPPPPPPPPVVVAPPRDPYGPVMAGVLDIPRASETAAIDGCAKVHKGLTMGGGFLFFTCEKLLPGVDISRHTEVAQNYQDALAAKGWEMKFNDRKKVKEYISYDPYGCKMTVSVKPWTDRSMNEKRGTSRADFRQIVFMTHFAKGQACEPAYQSFRNNAFQF